jgi:hypothetical protein
LSGTVAQPDAGLLAGGPFELTGGFWFATVPGDCGKDGAVDLTNYVAFETCLSGPGEDPSVQGVAVAMSTAMATSLWRISRSFSQPAPGRERPYPEPPYF